MSVLRIPHLEGHLVYAALFKDVSNTTFLRQQLIEGNAEFEYAFLDASSVNSSAIHKN
jgi:EKC/KEOPS complex subunit CGI121/TPRKB